MNAAIQAKQIRPLNLISGTPLPALTMIQHTESGPPDPYRTGAGTFIARLEGLDPRLIVTAAANLKIHGGGAYDPSLWPDQHLIKLSIYPVNPCNGEDHLGAPDPNNDDRDVYPIQRNDGSILTSFGFSIQPTQEAYDLVLRVEDWDYPDFYFGRLTVLFSAFAGIHPAAHVPDALALYQRVKLSALTRELQLTTHL